MYCSAMPFSRKPRVKTPKNRLRSLSGWGACLLVLGSFTFPAQFVTEQPGPTFNTIGEYEGKQLISIEGAETYPVTGRLDMTTVSVAGGPNTDILGLQVLGAWLSPSHTVYPRDVLYAPTTTAEQVSSRNSADMVSSQELAQAAALNYLEKDYKLTLTVSGEVEDSPSAGLFQEGDVLATIDGQKITQYQQIAETLEKTQGQTIDVSVKRGSETITRQVTPTYNAEADRWLLGLYLSQKYEFPMTVNYGLENVGGPSAGMMFALGIIDELTEEDLTGGIHFAGTGTIDAEGKVGPIGGVVQKMQGAKDAGASVFLAPAGNCAEVVGNIPQGLSVLKIETLEEAADAVRAIGQGTDPANFETCTP